MTNGSRGNTEPARSASCGQFLLTHDADPSEARSSLDSTSEEEFHLLSVPKIGIKGTSEPRYTDEAGKLEGVELATWDLESLANERYGVGHKILTRPRKYKKKIIAKYVAWAVVALLIASTVGVNHEKLLRRFRLDAASSQLQLCEEDPFGDPLGYIWRGQGAMDIRWIPYKGLESMEYSQNSGRSNRSVRISDSLDPTMEALAHSAPAYNHYLLESNLTWLHPQLSWLRNKTVASIGDSHDRNNLYSFCNLHKHLGAFPGPYVGHEKASCRIEVFNFTMVSWFHFGMAEEEETWYMRSEPAPYGIEERIEKVFVPDAQGNTGYPSLIVLNSFYWDLRYFALYAEHYGHASNGFLGRQERPLTWSELEWHRMRLTKFVEAVRRSFPGVPLMFRLGQEHESNRNEGNIGVFQLNRSSRALMSWLKIPIFEWAQLISGEDQYGEYDLLPLLLRDPFLV